MRLVLWPQIWSILVKVLCALKKNAYSVVFWWSVLQLSTRSKWLIVFFKSSIFLLTFYTPCWVKTLKPSFIIVDLSISPFFQLLHWFALLSEKSAVILIIFPFSVTCFFLCHPSHFIFLHNMSFYSPLSAFRIFSLSLVLSSFILMCQYSFLHISVLRICCVLWICTFIAFIKFGNFSTIISSDICSAFSSSEALITHILSCLKLSHSSMMLYSIILYLLIPVFHFG